MPVLSYKPTLIESVVNGSKSHTVRIAKTIWKPGDNAIHATGVRTSAYMEHRRDIVTRVDPVILKPCGIERFQVSIVEILPSLRHDFSDEPIRETKHHTLERDALHLLATNDGFDCIESFFRFFAVQYGSEKTLKGQLIQWGTPPIDYTAI